MPVDERLRLCISSSALNLPGAPYLVAAVLLGLSLVAALVVT